MWWSGILDVGHLKTKYWFIVNKKIVEQIQVNLSIISIVWSFFSDSNSFLKSECGWEY